MRREDDNFLRRANKEQDKHSLELEEHVDEWFRQNNEATNGGTASAEIEAEKTFRRPIATHISVAYQERNLSD
jgi:hypothetical protein